jgi:hypothetical protein
VALLEGWFAQDVNDRRAQVKPTAITRAPRSHGYPDVPVGVFLAEGLGIPLLVTGVGEACRIQELVIDLDLLSTR